MSLFSTLNAGATGLGATSRRLEVIGDNISNLNTTGFKSGRVQFGDVLPQYMGGLGGRYQVGRGVAVNTVNHNFSQGSLQGTSSALDVALGGKGFFAVRDGDRTLYTRDGSFQVDDQSFMVNGLGQRVQGYQAVNGQLTSTVGDISLEVGPLPQRATTEIALDMVLDARAEYTDASGTVTTPFAALSKDGSATAATLQEMSAAADYATSSTVYDSLGNPHEVTLFFERTDAGEFTYSAVIDGGEVDFDGDGVADGGAGRGLEIASGTLTFDTDGELSGFTQTATATTWSWPGADAFAPDLRVGLDGAGAEVDGSVSLAGTTATTTAIRQDGYAPSYLVNLGVDDAGVVTAQYDNGESRVLAQLAVAMFDSEQGLERVGGNLWDATEMSGEAALGVAGAGGRGATTGYALEGSNVNLEDQFVDMIGAQRTYQANSGVVRATDTVLQVLVSLV